MRKKTFPYKSTLILFSLFILLTVFLLYYIPPKTPPALQRHFPSGMHEVVIPPVTGIRHDLLNQISLLVEKAITEGKYPGAVILVGHRGQIVYQGVFGNRRIVPDIAPMQLDTLFDMASLTKVIATTPAIMQLIEQGKLDLDTPVAYYWPAFAKQGKDAITIRELLTHTSGLPADLPGPKNQENLITYPWHGQQAAYNEIERTPLINSPGKKVVYSDINFLVLGHLIELISGESLNQYTQNHIFKPLGMTHTFFSPSTQLQGQIAPTQIIDNHLHWGEVHDPTAYAMGGIAGNAGLFSNAHDLSIYAQTLLNNERPADPAEQIYHLLGPLTILKMTTPQTPKEITGVRGLGWDIDSSYSNRGTLFPLPSYGHTGWTGTSIWIDPVTQTWVIILTSRTHPAPAPENPVPADRQAIANIVAASITDTPVMNVSNTGTSELMRAYQANEN